MNKDFRPIKETSIQEIYSDILHYETNQLEELLEKMDEKMLTNEIFFACQNCSGPLIPSSICVVCRKSLMRTCRKCGTQKSFGSHLLCCYLVLVNKNKKT